ncbi:MAG TPA: hypothetical protein ENJ65_02120 [Candidatus Tenderia electrophaga]|uniref:Uncharacterized protein n=1 Tax=Candidatus Tenderia electrophaga TaxID=1748243 RepID=A0A832J2M8_9GAMM|nr:hypothetical protein [Candidatus Tenderia electrophaga]
MSTNFVGDWRVGANESLAEGTIGVIKNIKVYDAPVGGNLIAEWRINDNSNTIVDSVGGANGTLTLGSGSWEETGDLLAPQTLELINCANTTRDGLYRFGSIYSAVKDVGAAWAYEKQATSVNTLWVKDGTVDVNIGWGDTPEDAMVVRQTIAAGDSVLVPVTGSYIAWQAAADGTVHIEQSVAR